MDKNDHSELLNAIGAMNADELGELIEKTRKVFHLSTFTADSHLAKLHIFSSVVQYVPCLYYDGGSSTTIWIDDPGTDINGFVALFQDVIDPSFSGADMRRMKLLCQRGKSFKYTLDYGPAISFKNRLETLGASFEYEDDFAADYKEVKLCSLPVGLEEKLYQAIVMTEGGEPLSETEEFTVYVYRLFADAADRKPVVPDDAFVSLDVKRSEDGRLYREALSCLDKDEMRTLRRQGIIRYGYADTAPYHVRIGSESRRDLRRADDFRAVKDLIIVKYWPDDKVNAIKMYRRETGVGLSEAKYAINLLFDSQ